MLPQHSTRSLGACLTPTHVLPARSEGLRQDGRRPHELRRLACRLDVLPTADGSALLDQGTTKVLAAVYGPREATLRGDILHDRCAIRCDCTYVRA